MSMHAAIIMDGNGRWAQARGRPRPLGHRAGVEALRRVVESSPDLGISVLTLYAFSSDNWNRPAGEVRALMALMRRYLRWESPRLAEAGVRLQVLGRRDRLPPSVVAAIEAAEAATDGGRRLLLRLCVDYSARAALCAGVNRLAGCGALSGTVTEGEMEGAMLAAINGDAATPPVDLLIRTGGEQRLSDFLLWEVAYAEMLFLPVLWPDFTGLHLASAVRDFQSRDRRFGRVAPLAAPA